MLKKYKNQFRQIIEESGLDPRKFEAKDVGEKKLAFAIRLASTPLAFVAGNSSSSFHSFHPEYVRFDPGYTSQVYGVAFSPDETFSEFGEWLENHVKAYLDEQAYPDLWEQLKDQRPIISADGTETAEDLESFTDAEKDQIRYAIDDLRLLVKSSFESSDEQDQLVNRKLDYLADAVDRLNRFDWRSLAITTLWNISKTLMLSGGRLNELVALFQKVFSQLMALVEYVPPQ